MASTGLLIGAAIGGGVAAIALHNALKATKAMGPRIWSPPQGVIVPPLDFGAPVPSGKLVVPGGPIVEGIDVSWYQDIWSGIGTRSMRLVKGNDWTTIAKYVGFAICKATEGLSIVDPSFSRNWALSEDLPTLRRGAYHYCRMGDSAIEQAKKMYRTTGPLKARDLPPAGDLEWQGNLELRDPKAVTVWLRAFFGELAQLYGRRPLLYTSIGYWGYIGNPQDQDLAQILLWVAHHTVSTKPMLPAAWATLAASQNLAFGKESGWVFHQYSGGVSAPGAPTPRTVPGIGNGNPVDLDRFVGTPEDLSLFIERTRIAA